MKTYLHLQNALPDDLPAGLRDDDVRYPEGLVEHFLAEYTREGNVVFDPFAGFGTTLAVAERMGRLPYGVELDPARADYARSRLQNPGALVHGDSRRLALLRELRVPPIDFSMTSPPYMNRDDAENPLTGYSGSGKGYGRYLQELRGIYAELRRILKPAATVVIEAANLKRAGVVTMLAWDIAAEVSKVLRFEGEVVVCWDRYRDRIQAAGELDTDQSAPPDPMGESRHTYGYGYDHSYCLVFSAI